MFGEIGHYIINKLLNYIKDSYQHDPFRILLELLLIFIALKYLFSREVSRKGEVLSEKEISALIEEWIPSEIEGSDEIRNCLDEDFEIDLRDTRFLDHPEALKTELQDVVGKYGVGTCGPRGFYGTIDLHQVLEEKTSKFMAQESAVIYSQAFSAVSSTIPAFVKRDDIVFVDEYANKAIQIGLKISRGTVYSFLHNDMEDLEAKLIEVEKLLTEKKISPPRKFVVVEGLYFNTGSICPLNEIIRLKEKHKCRVILDESYSLGTISFKGGLPSQNGIPANSVEITLGSYTNSVGSAGGFSCGSIHVSDHQRLSSQAYCFSASMPAILTKYSIKILDLLENENNESVVALRKTIESFYGGLKLRNGLKLMSSLKSPIVCISASNCLKVESLYDFIRSKGIGVNLIQLTDQQKIIQLFLSSKQLGNVPKILKIFDEAMQNV